MPGRRRKGLWPEGVGVHPPGSLLDLMAQWIRDLTVRQYSPDTLRGHLGSLGMFAAWLDERDIRHAAQVTRGMIEVYQRHLHRCRQDDERPLSPMQQYKRLKTIAHFFGWAVRKGHLHANPASDLEYPRLPSTLPETLTEAEIAAVLAAPDLTDPEGLRERTVMEILYSTGLRRAEVVHLTLTDVDHERGLVCVRAGKGRKDRFVPIGKRALHWLDRYLAEVRPRFCHTAGEYRIFLMKSGEPCTPGMMGVRIYKLMRAAGIAKRGACHLFRHSMASHLLEAGCDVRVIGQMLGHTDLQTTAKYTRVGILSLCRLHATFHPAEQAAAPAPTPAAGGSVPLQAAADDDRMPPEVQP